MNSEFWNNYYQEQSTIWIQPDEVFATEVAELTSGNALELGAGEGADCLFLAKSGWQVTAIDFSQKAIDRINRQADKQEITINTEVNDILTYQPEQQFDLVYMVFIHLPLAERKQMLANAVNALALGGTLLFIGIANSDMDCDQEVSHLFSPAKDIAALLLEVAPDLHIEKQGHLNRTIPMPDKQSFKAETIIVKAKKLSNK
ncbi:class I SAM-dependent methyltransferase [Endozoicomonas sp. SM1973]|uniref:Class I SAM-dependent methyltransferase n=1 Tax=Spartinivicinus marinus TaxID=2994442 RepID=A0A853HT44_9GAMM|nr:class I SAM-dependent methyltransferase [Spartinivicinus marinus]MCX4029375.1 class I SAM-dependent methyltransferase [Spartinivicinus marinus]NYZ64950.1 class I SAM-dependent methyltransferase [Spartinivicinus marinus]